MGSGVSRSCFCGSGPQYPVLAPVPLIHNTMHPPMHPVPSSSTVPQRAVSLPPHLERATSGGVRLDFCWLTLLFVYRWFSTAVATTDHATACPALATNSANPPR